jgi:hypothetical protein
LPAALERGHADEAHAGVEDEPHSPGMPDDEVVNEAHE